MSLAHRNCRPIAPGTLPLGEAAARELLDQLEGNWQLDPDFDGISLSFRFDNYYQTIAFVNTVAWIAHKQDHHPDLQVSYNRCHIHLATHSVGGLSENDFIFAARVDALTEAEG